MRWGVEGSDYVVWRGLLTLAGDKAMAARLNAIHAAEQADCPTTITLPDGSTSRLPLMMVAEAAVAAAADRPQAAWRGDLLAAMLHVAAEAQEDEATEAVVALVNSIGPVADEMKATRVWPWLGRRRRASSAAEADADE